MSACTPKPAPLKVAKVENSALTEQQTSLPISLGIGHAKFYKNPNPDSGEFTANIDSTVLFEKDFPIINFNPGNNCAKMEDDPWINVIDNERCVYITSKGGGFTAGINPEAFQMSYEADLVVEKSGQITLNVTSDDGWILAIGKEKGSGSYPYYDGDLEIPGALSGSYANYPVLLGVNTSKRADTSNFTITLPRTGKYPIKLGYAQCCCCGKTLTLGSEFETPIPPTNPWLRSNRYVAFGDSVSYGHGLVNPGHHNATVSGMRDLPPNQGPAQESYPVQVANYFGLDFEVRQTSCEINGDHLAISGATSTRQNLDKISAGNSAGRDNDCPDQKHHTVADYVIGALPTSTKPHKSLDPEQLSAANLLSDPPKLITVMIGANDLKFDKCLVSELTNPTGLKCVWGSQKDRMLPPQVSERMFTLGDELKYILTYIEARAPKAKILVLNYYQVVPAPSTEVKLDLLIDSSICHRLFYMTSGGRKVAYGNAKFLQDQLNDTIADAIIGHKNAELVDISTRFDGHEMCTQNPYVFDSPTWRAAHPNTAGQYEIFNAIAEYCKPRSICNL